MNIRNIDEELMREWKAKAARHGLTLKGWIIAVLSEACAGDNVRLERGSKMDLPVSVGMAYCYKAISSKIGDVCTLAKGHDGKCRKAGEQG